MIKITNKKIKSADDYLLPYLHLQPEENPTYRCFNHWLGGMNFNRSSDLADGQGFCDFKDCGAKVHPIVVNYSSLNK